MYRDLHATSDTIVEGHGLIPLASALPEGAPSILLDDAVHGQWPGDWYGSERFLDAWWGRALETWRSALVARVELATVLAAFDGSGDRR